MTPTCAIGLNGPLNGLEMTTTSGASAEMSPSAKVPVDEVLVVASAVQKKYRGECEGFAIVT